MIVNIAMQMKDRFYKLVAIGLATLYATQVILTIGGAIKFIPSTGVTLPLVSYGGSSLLSTLVIFGIVQGLYMRKTISQMEKVKMSEASVEQVQVERQGNDEVALIHEQVPQNKEFQVVTYIFVAIFAGMLLYFVYFLTFKSEDFINNEYNGLQTLFEDDVVRGDIITSDGYVVAETKTDADGSESRNYPYEELFAHVVGYTGSTRTGLERQLNFGLLRSHGFFVEQIVSEFTGEKLLGDDVITTLRYDLQKIAYDALGKYDGAVVAIEPTTGEILAMVSKPDFDPNTITEDWEKLQEGSALYNRATQGQYTPGSIFKMFTTLAYIESNPNTWQDYSYECKGKITLHNKTVHCASNKAHGTVDMEESFAKSCNASYVNMMESIDEEVFQKLCNTMLFNQNLPIALESGVSSFSVSEGDTHALKMDTAIGQGKTLVSPLHMAMLVGAICNDGVVMRPYLVEQTQNYNGIVVEETQPKAYKTLFTDTQTALLSQYMRSVVEDGTASKLKSEKYTAYGKTGTAQTSSDLDNTNAWFVGYAKKDGKSIAIAVVVEDSGSGSSYAVPIAKKVFDAYFPSE